MVAHATTTARLLHRVFYKSMQESRVDVDPPTTDLSIRESRSLKEPIEVTELLLLVANSETGCSDLGVPCFGAASCLADVGADGHESRER